MRNSSMKSIIAALSISVTLLGAVPTATAGPVQNTRGSQSARSREDGPARDRFAAIRQFINRTLRRVGSHNGPSIPIPKQEDQD
ncbi:MAG: hypothetical protein ACXWLY_22920 [Thermoanaerobaculia bacterium]